MRWLRRFILPFILASLIAWVVPFILASLIAWVVPSFRVQIGTDGIVIGSYYFGLNGVRFVTFFLLLLFYVCYLPKVSEVTGFVEVNDKGKRQPKTLWHWLELLLIPIIIAGGGLWFQTQQHDSDFQIAVNQQRETILKTYMDDISNLLLQEKLRKSKPGDEVRIIAKIKTFDALRQLDGTRKGRLIRFIFDLDLIKKESIISLEGADLTRTDLAGAALSEANLTKVDLTGADLSNANLAGANLTGARLFSKRIPAEVPSIEHYVFSDPLYNIPTAEDYTVIDNTNKIYNLDKNGSVEQAVFNHANLAGVNLKDAIALPEQFSGICSFTGAILPNGSKYPSKTWTTPKIETCT